MNHILPLTEKDRKRFWAKVERRDGECWPWLGAKTPEGRGRFMLRGKNVVAPRVAWAIANGSEPEMLVLHRCDNPNCVNPAHLWLGSNRDNCVDMASKGRHHKQQVEHCPKGHPYNERNTKFGRTGRSCSECNRIYLREYNRRRRSGS